MSEQQKTAELTEYKPTHIIPSLIYVLITIFVISFFWFQKTVLSLLLPKILSEAMIFTSLYAVFLSFINITFWIIQIRNKYPPNMEEMYSSKANHILGPNVQEFHKSYRTQILKDDLEIKDLSSKIGTRRIIFFTLSSGLMFATVIGIYYIFAIQHMWIQVLSILFVVSGNVGLNMYFMLNIQTLKKDRAMHVELAVMIYNEYLERMGINLSTTPKTRSQRQIVEFLELANFMEKYYSKYNQHKIRGIIHGSLYFVIGAVFHWGFNPSSIINDLGLIIMTGAIIYGAISYVLYTMEKQVNTLAAAPLSNYLFTL